MTSNSSNDHQFAKVNLNGRAAELIRRVMRRTGWNVDQSLAHIIDEADRAITNHKGPILGLAIEGNVVGVQVVSNTITAYPFEVGDVVQVRVLTDDDDTTLKLYGVVNGFAPQGVGITLTDRSVSMAEGYDVQVNKDDLWSYEEVVKL